MSVKFINSYLGLWWSRGIPAKSKQGNNKNNCWRREKVNIPKTRLHRSLELHFLDSYSLWASILASAKSSNRTARADRKKIIHEFSCALAKSTICFLLCQQNLLMWEESFSINFQHLKMLLGFWACCTDTMLSGIWAHQCLCAEKTNELGRPSLHRHIPENLAAVFSTVRTFSSLRWWYLGWT